MMGYSDEELNMKHVKADGTLRTAILHKAGSVRLHQRTRYSTVQYSVDTLRGD